MPAKLRLVLFLVVAAALMAAAGAMDPTRPTAGKQQQVLQSNVPDQKGKGGAAAAGGGGGGRQPRDEQNAPDDVAENAGAADLSALETPADLSHLPAGAAATEAKSKELLEMLGPDMPLHAVANDISFIGFSLERDDKGAERQGAARPAVLVGVREASKRDSVLAAVRRAVNDDHILVQSYAIAFDDLPEEESAALLEAEAEVEVDVGAGAWRTRTRPIRGGGSIGRCARGNAGTLGGFLTKAGSPAIRYGVTNMHVLSAGAPHTGAVPVGARDICQPGRADGGRAPADAFGEFKAGLYNTNAAGGNIDFAVFKVNGGELRQTRCSLRADHLGGPYAIVGVANIAVGNSIHKFGRTTEHTRSNVALTGAVVMAGTARGNVIAVSLPNTLGPALAGPAAGLVVPGNPFGWSGDSGAFYVRRAPGAAGRFNVVGLNKGRVTIGGAGGVRYAFGYTIQHVLATINANGLTNGAIPAGHLPLTVCTSNPHLL